jgi:hypothetical protein
MAKGQQRKNKEAKKQKNRNSLFLCLVNRSLDMTIGRVH